MKEDNCEHSLAQNVLNSVLSHYGFDLMMLFDKIGIEYRNRIYDIRKGKTKMMSKPIIDALKRIWPELNEVYLRTGRGEMLLTQPAEEKKEELGSIDMPGVVLHLVSVIQQQTQAINEMRKELELMKLYVIQQQPKSYDFDPFTQGRKAADDSEIK